MWTCMRRLQNDSLQKLKGPHSSRPLANYHHSQPTWNRSTLTTRYLIHHSIQYVSQQLNTVGTRKGKKYFLRSRFVLWTKKKRNQYLTRQSNDFIDRRFVSARTPTQLRAFARFCKERRSNSPTESLDRAVQSCSDPPWRNSNMLRHSSSSLVTQQPTDGQRASRGSLWMFRRDIVWQPVAEQVAPSVVTQMVDGLAGRASKNIL